jgi:quercetin dioxygenase-like cupin family protein
MKRAVRWAVVSAGLAGVIVAVTLASVQATPPVALTNTLLAQGTNQSSGTIPLQAGTNVVMAQITVAPGGVSGWHSHPGGAIIVVQQGSVTVFESVGSKCETKTYTAGQSFVERPGEVDQVKNTGTIPYTLFVTFPRVPVGVSPRTDEPDPGSCPGI